MFQGIYILIGNNNMNDISKESLEKKLHAIVLLLNAIIFLLLGILYKIL